MRKFFKRNRMIFFFVVLIGIYFAYNMHASNQKMEELNSIKAQLESEIRVLENELIKLNDAYDYVQTPEAVERAAREKLRMVRPNEIIFMIREQEPTNSGGTP